MIFAPVNSPEWDAALPDILKDFLASGNSIPEGKVVLIPDQMWVNCFFVTPEPDDGAWENHHEYWDLHQITEGEELCLIAPEADCVPRGEYNASDDYQLFDGPLSTACRLTLRPGTMLLIAPGEVHLPGVSVAGDRTSHRKVVVKIHHSLMKRH